VIRIFKDGEVIKETEDIQTLVQFLDYYGDHPIKMVEFRINHDEIEEKNRRQAAELSD
tara:strand:- start:13 stop:186 length:174 start_codon:yes stop_codon:yes gene_type:complete